MKVRCPICSSDNNREIYSDNNAPLFQNKTYSSKEEAIATDKGSIHLHLCDECGFVWNNTFEPSRLIYDSDYQNEQSHSQVFMDHLSTVIKIIEKKNRGRIKYCRDWVWKRHISGYNK